MELQTTIAHPSIREKIARRFLMLERFLMGVVFLDAASRVS